MKKRCAWAENDRLMSAYHDEEWGVPEGEGRALWEKLILDGFQAGLSWRTILYKRQAFRDAFRGFDPGAVARFSDRDVERLMNDEGIVRSRPKIEAAIGNAKAYLSMQKGGEDFARFCWEFVGKKPLQNAGAVPAKTALSQEIAAALKKRGFKFVGPVAVYAWMQAVGLVNDHGPECFRRRPVARMAAPSLRQSRKGSRARP